MPVWIASVTLATFLPIKSLRADIFEPEVGSSQEMLLNFLEVFAANSSTNSGETSSSLINSVRNNTSIYSSQIVKYTEVSANRQNTVSPGFRYNRRFEGSDFFIGVSYAETTNLTFLRQIYGNDNSYFRDRTNARERTSGIMLGAGPLDFTTAESSTEFSFSYSRTRSRGPYSQWFYKQPSWTTVGRIAENPTSSEAALDNYRLNALSFGYTKFDVDNYGMRFGFVGSMSDWLNIYVVGDLQILSGSLSMTTFSRGTVEQAIPSATTPTFPNPNYITIMEASLFGLLYRAELGFVLKVIHGMGIRVGYYGQLPYVDLTIKNSFDNFRSLGADPYLLGLTEPQPTSLSDRQTFVHGGYVAFVSKF